MTIKCPQLVTGGLVVGMPGRLRGTRSLDRETRGAAGVTGSLDLVTPRLGPEARRVTVERRPRRRQTRR